MKYAIITRNRHWWLATKHSDMCPPQITAYSYLNLSQNPEELKPRLAAEHLATLFDTKEEQNNCSCFIQELPPHTWHFIEEITITIKGEICNALVYENEYA